MILHLGVVDIPYGHSPKKKKGKGGKAQASSTGDVAEILEKKYSIMQFFFDAHKEEIIGAMSEAVGGSFESVVMGAPAPKDVHAAAMSEIQTSFQKFLDQREMDYKVAGVPTAAAQKGVSHRRAHPYAKANPARASFVDTGAYSASMRAWVEE